MKHRGQNHFDVIPHEVIGTGLNIKCNLFASHLLIVDWLKDTFVFHFTFNIYSNIHAVSFEMWNKKMNGEIIQQLSNQHKFNRKPQ
jgi:hypothetical protein